MDETQEQSQFYTLRLWKEDVGADVAEWRGRAQHVLSGQSCYFRDWTALIGFITQEKFNNTTAAPTEISGKEE
jgi:hypothetical protein